MQAADLSFAGHVCVKRLRSLDTAASNNLHTFCCRVAPPITGLPHNLMPAERLPLLPLVTGATT